MRVILIHLMGIQVFSKDMGHDRSLLHKCCIVRVIKMFFSFEEITLY
jgi:hypothetical protein